MTSTEAAWATATIFVVVGLVVGGTGYFVWFVLAGLGLVWLTTS